MAHEISKDKIAAYVTNHLCRYYPELSSHELSLSQGYSRTYRWSDHLEFAVLVDGSTIGSDILIKVPRACDCSGRRQVGTRPDSQEKSSEREYEALRTLHRHLADDEMGGITAVRPLGFIPEFAAIVMEKVPGRNLLEIAEAAVTLGQEVLATQAARKAGGLLRALHRIDHGDYPRRAALDKEGCLTKLSSFVDALQRLGLPKPYLRHLQDTVRIMQKAIDQIQEEISLTFAHGDFYPENIVISEQGAAYTIDTTLHRLAPTLEDVTTLLVGLDTMKLSILLGGGLIKRSAIEQMRSAFLHGYSGDEPLSSHMVTLYQIIILFKRWCEIYAVARQFQPVWLSAAIRHVRIDPFMDAQLRLLVDAL